MPSSLGAEIPRLPDLPAPNLQWKNQNVMKGMDWIAILVSVFLPPGNSQVSESFPYLNGQLKIFSLL